MSKMNLLDKIAGILVIIGALNWGLVGAFNFNLVTAIFGMTIISKIIFILVGLSGIVMIWSCIRCKKCTTTQ
jgi:hypothetical protein